MIIYFKIQRVNRNLAGIIEMLWLEEYQQMYQAAFPSL